MSLRSVSRGILLFLALAGSGLGQTAADAITQEVRKVFDLCHEAVVRIEAHDERGTLLGSGFFIDPSGTLYTTYSIGGQADEIEVMFKERKYPAKRLFADSRSGIALLKIEESTPFVITGSSSELTVASPVMLIGYPMDFAASPSFGLVAGFDTNYKGRYFSTAHIRASIPAQGGQGGAPLLNLKGEAVGILISSAVGGGACFGLPIEAAEKVRKDFVRFGEPRPGYLGAELVSGTSADSVASVMKVDQVGPAAKAGLREGDVVIEFNGRAVRTPEDVMSAAFYISGGDTVPLTVVRAGEQIQLCVQASDRAHRETKVTAQNVPLLQTPPVVPGEGLSSAGPGGEPEVKIEGH